MAPSLRPSQVIGEARRLLQEGGFTEADPIEIIHASEHRGVVGDGEEAPLDVETSAEILVFEDERSIVGLILYTSWADLAARWERAQAEMVARISQHLKRADPKSWDGYLVLLTLDGVASAEAVAQVRHDTRRLRKLVATGRELTAMSAIEDTLLPVLPFSVADIGTGRATLIDRLPEMLEAKGIDSSLAAAALASFRKNRSPMEGIWSWRTAR